MRNRVFKNTRRGGGERARKEVEGAERMKERPTIRHINSTYREIICSSCKCFRIKKKMIIRWTYTLDARLTIVM